jgi:nucleoid-associated protein YgaU
MKLEKDIELIGDLGAAGGSGDLASYEYERRFGRGNGAAKLQRWRFEAGAWRYVVQPGDTFWSIATELTGNVAEWETLWRFQDAYYRERRDPSAPCVGDVLAVPPQIIAKVQPWLS